MKISNLTELLNAKVLNEGSMLSIGGFALNLKDLKPSFAFFSNDKDSLKEAVKMGAFVVISEKEIRIDDKDVFYLLCEDLQKALLRLLRFLSDEKNLKFVLCDKMELEFAKIFNIQPLNSNAFLDFHLIKNAKNGGIFCLDDATYLLKLCANYQILCETSFMLKENASLFFSTFVYKENLYKNLSLAPFYVKFFIKWLNFLETNVQKLTFDLKKLECYTINFVNEKFEITEFGKASKAFILVFDEINFNLWQEALSDVKGFKTALQNSLFCDFSYNTLEDLKTLKDFKYCLILLKDKGEFIELFSKKKEEENLLF